MTPAPAPADNHLAEASPGSDRLAELETICRYDRAGDTASVFTCERGLAATLRRRGLKPTRENRRRGRVESWLFEVPKSWISVRPPRRMSESSRRALAERVSLLRKPPHGAGITTETAPEKG